MNWKITLPKIITNNIPDIYCNNRYFAPQKMYNFGAKIEYRALTTTKTSNDTKFTTEAFPKIKVTHSLKINH